MSSSKLRWNLMLWFPIQKWRLISDHINRSRYDEWFFHFCHIFTLLGKFLLKAFRPSSIRCKSKAMQTRAWLCFNLCAGNFQDNLALFWFTSSLPVFLHLRQLSQNAGDFNAKQTESVKKPSDQGEDGGRGYLCSRGRGWELLSRQQRARRGSVGRHKVLPARRPASHWRQPQLILGAPRQPPSCPATCSWVWIARLLLQTPPSPSPFCNLQHLEPEENDYSLHSVVLLLAATTLMIFIKKDRVSGASVTSKSSLYSAQQEGCL